MKMIHSQKGMSMWVVMTLLIGFALVGLLFLKIGPVYLDSFKVDRALTGLMEDSDIKTMTKGQIKEAFLKRADIDGVEGVTYKNFNDVATVGKDGEQVTLEFTYDIIVPLMGNLSALMEFEKSGGN